jgi:Transcriptional regulator, AbiEi antitoxin
MRLIDLISTAQKEELVSDIKQMIGSIAALPNAQYAESSKDFFTTKEMKERGWSEAQINKFVESGRLTRIEAGGKAGYKYPAIQVQKLLKELYDDVYFTHTKRKNN